MGTKPIRIPSSVALVASVAGRVDETDNGDLMADGEDDADGSKVLTCAP